MHIYRLMSIRDAQVVSNVSNENKFPCTQSAASYRHPLFLHFAGVRAKLSRVYVLLFSWA